jgi:hypothetical protein
MRICVGLVLVLSVSGFALDLMGPPKSGLDCGNWGFGAAYFASEEDLELDFMGLSIDDLETQRYYGWISFAPVQGMELYARLGSIDVEFDDLDIDDNSNFIGTLGTKVTFIEGDALDWGVLAQWGISEIKDVDIIGTETDVEFDEIQVAAGPTVTFGNIKIYGGPMFYSFDGEIDEFNVDLEEDSGFGGYVGAVFELGNNMALHTEGVFTGGGYGIGVNIGWEF